jgi:hypothetical protein
MSTHKPSHNLAQVWQLHYGSARVALVVVVPDDRWPGMFRLAWPSGEISDMVNLSRARDAAVAVCTRGPPQRDQLLFRWESHPLETPAKAVYARSNGGGAA